MTPTAATNAIFRAHALRWPGDCFSGAHPLQGKTVREWVQEARAGWPRVPVPRDPVKAAQKVAEKHADMGVEFDYV